MILGQVDASGKLVLYDYQHARGSSRASLAHMMTEQVVEKASCLSLDWNNRKHVQYDDTLAQAHLKMQ